MVVPKLAAVSVVVSIVIAIISADESFEMEMAKSQQSQVDDHSMHLPHIPQTSN